MVRSFFPLKGWRPSWLPSLHPPGSCTCDWIAGVRRRRPALHGPSLVLLP